MAATWKAMKTNLNISEAQLNIRRWRLDPIAFVRENFGVEPDPWQCDFLIAYNTGRRVAAKACKGPGKTAVLAWCMWHFMVTRPHCKIPATSITGDNLRDGLWAELAKWQQKSKFLREAFTWRPERVEANGHKETWFMSARKWSQSADKEQQANALAGLHADYIMFVLDEAGGIPDAVMVAAEAALASGIECKILICGNPTHLSGPLYRACTKEASLWKVIEITGDPDNPKRSSRINIDWAREQIKAWGRDNPWVMVNVLGQFPPSSINALLGPDDVEKAMTRIVPWEAYSASARVLGVDVALGGGDRTVLMPRQGIVMFKPKILRLDDPKSIASEVAVAIQRWQPDAVNIDNTGGWGSGVISHLRDWGYSVNDVLFSGKATNNIYFNKRTEMHYEAAYWVKGGGCLPRMPELKEEACAQTYTHKKDKLLMTEKAQVKEELGRSPDLWDAACLTFAFPVAKQTIRSVNHQSAGINYDPVRQHIEQMQAQQQGQNGIDYIPKI